MPQISNTLTLSMLYETRNTENLGNTLMKQMNIVNALKQDKTILRMTNEIFTNLNDKDTLVISLCVQAIFQPIVADRARSL